MGEALKQAQVDHIIDNVPLKVGRPVQWEHKGRYLKSIVPIVGATTGSVNAKLVMDVAVSKALPGKYTFQLRQTDAAEAVLLRRLDVRGTHTNNASNDERWNFRTHKHRWRDSCGDSFAYTPDDIPDTTAPPDSPNPGEHEEVFKAFCGECGIDDAGAWTAPPLDLGADPATCEAG